MWNFNESGHEIIRINDTIFGPRLPTYLPSLISYAWSNSKREVENYIYEKINDVYFKGFFNACYSYWNKFRKTCLIYSYLAYLYRTFFYQREPSLLNYRHNLRYGTCSKLNTKSVAFLLTKKHESGCHQHVTRLLVRLNWVT